tara:strand:+ start:589 stop:852 length:264 start_codon:yes stop_codon:yes gene_type:complete
MTYQINLNTTTPYATNELYKLDKSFINTSHYMGLAYFWSYDYAHTGLRKCSVAKRKKVHKKLLEARLNVSDTSNKHFKIIMNLLKGV